MAPASGNKNDSGLHDTLAQVWSGVLLEMVLLRINPSWRGVGLDVCYISKNE